MTWVTVAGLRFSQPGNILIVGKSMGSNITKLGKITATNIDATYETFMQDGTSTMSKLTLKK